MADERIEITVDSNTSQLESALSTIISQLGQLGTTATNAGGNASRALDDLGNKAQDSGNKVKKHKQELDGLQGTLEKISRTGSGVATTFEMFGMEAGAAAQHVRLMNEAIKELSAAALPLVAAFVAVEAGIKAFEFLKDAADDAGKLQQALAILGATVTAQGGNWKSLSKDVMEYAEQQERTTTYSRSEVISALTQLTSAHMKLSDAMKVNRVAEDAAAATGQSLNTINHALVEAMHGRTQALTMLGIGTKQSIKDGMSFHDVLGAIEKQMGGAAAAAANTYPGALKQLGNSWESLMEDVGTPFLGMLTSVVHAITSFIQNMQAQLKHGEDTLKIWRDHNKQFLNDVGLFFKGCWDVIRVVLDAIVAILHGTLDEIMNIISIFGDLLEGHWGNLWGDVKKLFGDGITDVLHGFGDFGHNMILIAERTATDVGKAFGAMWKDIKSGHFGDIGKDVAASFSGLTAGLSPWSLKGDLFSGFSPSKSTDANLPDINIDDNAMVGGGSGKGKHTKGKGAHSYSQFSKADDIFGNKAELDANAAAIHKIDEAWKNVTKTIAGYTAVQSQAREEIKKIQPEEDKANKTAAIKIAAYEEARKKYNDYIASLKNGTPANQEQQKQADAYKKAMDKAAQAATKAQGAHKHLADEIQHLNGVVDAAQKKIDDYKKQWDEFTKSEAERMHESVATFEMSNDDKVKFYEDAIAHLSKDDADYEKKREELQKKADDAWIASQEEKIKKAKEFHDKAIKDISGFLDDVIVKHKSFKDIFKQIWDDLVKIVIDSIAKMIVESQLFKSVFGNLMPGNSGSGSGGFSLGSLFSMSAGSSGGSTAASIFGGGVPGVGNPSSVTGNSLASASLGGSVGAASVGTSAMAAGYQVTGALVDSSGNVTGFTAVNAAGQAVQTDASGNIINTTGNAMGGSPLGGGGRGGFMGSGMSRGLGTGMAALQGAAFGAAIGQSVYGGGSHTTWGSVGGAIGGAAGFYFGGPIGATIGEAIGSFVGGMFGHKDNPAQMPDKYDTVRFGTMVGELLGNNSHAPDPKYGFVWNQSSDQIMGQLGGKGMLPYVENWVSSHMNSQDPSIKALAQRLYGLFGDSGGGQLGFGQDIGQEWVIGGSLKGTYVDIWNAASDAINQINQLDPNGSMDPMATFNVSNMAGNYNLSSMTQVGTWDPGSDVFSLSPPSSSSGGSGGSGGYPRRGGDPGDGDPGSGDPRGGGQRQADFTHEIVINGNLAALAQEINVQSTRNYAGNKYNSRFSQ